VREARTETDERSSSVSQTPHLTSVNPRADGGMAVGKNKGLSKGGKKGAKKKM
jgi:hypothetical protein